MALKDDFYTPYFAETNVVSKTRLKVEWEAIQSVDDNHSVVEWWITCERPSSSGWVTLKRLALYIDGVEITDLPTEIDCKNGTELARGTVTLDHDEYGEKSFDMSVEVAIYYSVVNNKGSETFELNRIDKVVVMIANNGVFERYIPYIGNGTSWEEYIVRIDTTAPVITVYSVDEFGVMSKDGEAFLVDELGILQL